jgi:hypothetical protein
MQLQAPGASLSVTIVRCPECGSTEAAADESRSAYEFTFMHCPNCGHGALQDEYQIKDDWNVDIVLPDGMLPARVRCARCTSADAATAWTAMLHERVRSLVEESHYSIQITACRCGQHFVKVFTERIDWQGGDDDQDWLVFAIDSAEAERLSSAAESELHGLVTALGRDRRFLVHCNAGTWWRENGFMIGPHD